MNTSLSTGSGCRGSFQLHFRPITDTGPTYVFPCDGAGQVDLDALGARSLNDYLYARAVVGCEFARPEVIACLPRSAGGPVSRIPAVGKLVELET